MVERFDNHKSVPLPIGIVGGLGPYAGFDLVRKIYRWTKASTDQEHLPLMLHSFPGWIPERPAFLLGEKPENPGEDIGAIMAQLAQNGARVIGMPCNTAHSPRILDAALARLHACGSDVRFVSIIKSAVDHVRSMLPDGGRVGLMCTTATLRTGLYQDALQKAGLEAAVPREDECDRVQHAISDPEFGIKAFSDPVTGRARNILLDTAANLALRENVSVILLGCTEIPLAITENTLSDIPVIDATSVLARELIRASCPQRLKSPDNL